MKINTAMLSLMGFLILAGCKSDSQDKQKVNLQVPPEQQKLLDFFSENNRGKWNDLPQEHVPSVKVKKERAVTTITVTTPFANQPDHYLELIMLTDYALHEMQKEVYGKGSKEKSAVFILSPTTRGEFYIMLKCNLHDMWYKKILL